MVDGGDLPTGDAEQGEPPTDPTPPVESRGRPLVGYAVAGALVVILLVVAIAALAGGSGDDSGVAGGPNPDSDLIKTTAQEEDELLPDNGVFATPQEVESVKAAADAAGCDLESHDVASRDHVTNLDAKIDYSSNPPTSGRHYPIPAGDAAYEEAPNVKLLVHTLEHSRVIVWFQPDLPQEARAALKAFYDHDERQLLLVPDTTDMPYEVAASAWNAKPEPNGTGRLLGCPEYNDELFTALEAFKNANRGKGPEKIP
jgi:hypothetical protein